MLQNKVIPSLPVSIAKTCGHIQITPAKNVVNSRYELDLVLNLNMVKTTISKTKSNSPSTKDKSTKLSHKKSIFALANRDFFPAIFIAVLEISIPITSKPFSVTIKNTHNKNIPWKFSFFSTKIISFKKIVESSIW